MTKLSGKLIRDYLAQPIKLTHPTAEFIYLNGKEQVQPLQEKLAEEVAEFLAANSKIERIKEAGDILEVLECLVSKTLRDMAKIKESKAEEKDSFKSGLLWINKV